MNILESVLDALDNVRFNPMRSFLTMLGVVIGVFSVVVLVSIGEGAKKYVMDAFAGIGTNVLIITPGAAQTSGGPPITGLDTVHKLTLEDAEGIRARCPSVHLVAPVILAGSTIKRENRLRSRTTIIGTTYEIQEIRNFYVELGRFLPRSSGQAEKRVCVLGWGVAGDLFGGESPLGQWVKIGGSPYRVIGVMERKGYSLGFNIDDIVFISIQAAEELFDTDEMFEILAQTREADQLAPATAQIHDILRRRHNRTEDFTITDQRAMVDAFGKVLNVLTYALAGIAAISLLVGGIGIMNIMLVAVGEKTREIGLRKAVGATKGQILIQFLVESLAISGMGGVLGVLTGVGLGLLVHAMVPSLPVLVKPWAVLVSLGFSMFVGLFFGVYPAKKAADLDPLEALRQA